MTTISGHLGRRRARVHHGRLFFYVFDGAEWVRCEWHRPVLHVVPHLQRHARVEVTGELMNTNRGPFCKAESVQLVGGAP